MILVLLIYSCDYQIVEPQRDNPFDVGNELFSTDLFNLQTQNLSEHILISWEYTHEKPLLDAYLLYRVNTSGEGILIYTGIETAFEDSDVEWGSRYYYYVTGKINQEESLPPEFDELPEVVRGIYVGINSEYTKISDALNVLKDGDVIHVQGGGGAGSNGEYVENIDFAGKNIKLICDDQPGSCEIQGNDSGPVVSFSGNEDTTAVMNGFKIKGNNSTEDGGAMMINEGSGPLIKNCIFENNATTGDGGAIFCDRDATPIIENCTFTDNQAEGDGGAIYCKRDSEPIITNCTFEDNKSDGDGGAIAIDRASPQIELSTFRLNEAAKNGGAIYMRDSRDIDFIQSIFEYNEGDLGGALYIEDCDFAPKPIKFINCILWQNSGYRGAGIYSQESEIIIDYSTFTRNSALNGEGGALFLKMHNNVEITNSILWQNNAEEFPEIAAESGTNIVEANHSDIEGGEIHVGEGNINVDPKFEDESDGDLQLENDSDCIGTDSNSTQMGAWGNDVMKIGATED